MEGSQIPAGEQRVVTVGSFAAKYRSKYEIVSFLTIDGQVYLPPQANVTMYFCKQIICGEKKRKCAIISTNRL